MGKDKLIQGQAWHGVAYGSTHRAMPGVSQPPFDRFNLGLHCGGNPEHAKANRAALDAILPYPPIWLNQVHGIAVYDADVEWLTHEGQRQAKESISAQRHESESPWHEESGQEQNIISKTADASVTTRSDCVLAIMTADCLPVVLADAKGHVIGAAHAGWRGLCMGVLEATVEAMQAKKPVEALRAWIGPAISYDCFEVGEEVYQAFLEQDATLAQFFKPHQEGMGKWFTDLAKIAQYRLYAVGVEQVELSGLCTYQREDLFFSYRRQALTGRMATFVWKQ